MAKRARLTRDITAADLGIDSPDPDEGYQPTEIIGPVGSSVEVLNDEDPNFVEVMGFANDSFASGYVARSDIEESFWKRLWKGLTSL